ncbi:MAG: EAL domain-containing protein [Proteobacteria bacterium]|nr:EAL domain-containing protein [Pseudomonadota bacterium]
MLRILSSLGIEHDWRLLALAAVVSIPAGVVTMALVQCARSARDRVRLVWMLAAASVGGCGIWMAHLIAMLAYRPAAASYDFILAALSLASIVFATGLGIGVALSRKGSMPAAIGGAIAGVGMAGTHYLGILAAENGAPIAWSRNLIVLSVILAAALGAAAFLLAGQEERKRRMLGAGLLLGLTALSIHAVGMGAMAASASPDRTIAIAIAPPMLGFLLAMTAIAILGTGIGAVIFNRRLRAIYRRQRMRLTEAVDNMGHGLVMFDARGRLVTCNTRYLEMYGLSRDIVRHGCTLHELIALRVAAGHGPGQDPDRYIANLMANLAKGERSSQCVQHDDGRSVQVVNSPLADGGWVATHEDTTVLRRAQRHLEETRNFLMTVVEHVPVPIIVKNAHDLRYVLINRAAEDYFGMPRDGIIGKSAQEVFPLAVDIITRHDSLALAASGPLYLEEHPVQTPANGERIVSATRLSIADNDGKPQYLVAVLQDVTERRRAAEELQRTRNFLDTVIEHVPATIFVKSVHDFRYLLANRACEKFFGIPREQIIGNTAYDFFPRNAADVVAMRDRQLLERGSLEFPIEKSFHRPGESGRMISTKRLIIPGPAGEPKYIMGVIEDVTDRLEAEAKIAHLANHDILTDLPNRSAFNERLGRALEEAERTKAAVAVLTLGVDRFKEVNDVFGLNLGDALLRALSVRLAAHAGGGFLARLGGDEFSLFVADAQAAEIERLGDRLLEVAGEEFTLEGRLVRIGLSVGVAFYPNDGNDAAAVLANADAALNRAKAAGGGIARFFAADMDRRLRERHALVHDLRSSLARNEILVYYQPQADINGAITGFEALARWQHPVRGLVSPGVFIPAAEESGLINSLGEWILREVCREAASWPKPLNVAVNISPIQFLHGDLPALVHSVLLESGLAAERLELEVTEGVLIDDLSHALSVLRRLKLLGVRIAMDDFGTGYSSLSTLQAFPFDRMKIDRSFILNLDRNPQSATIVRAVIGLGRGLGLPVIAEGVETREHLAFLAAESCDAVQGFLIGKPLPIAAYQRCVGRSAVTKRRRAAAT